MSEDHKGLPVAGYKAQSQDNVDLVNRNKKLEELVLRVIDELQSNSNCDGRWVSIARTDIEKGFMALNRAIFKPARINGLPETELSVGSLNVSIKQA